METGDRRQKQKFHIDPVLRRGFKLNEVVVLPHDGTVVCQGEHRHLPPKAMEVLLFLCQNRNRAISNEKLLVFGWGDAEAKRANLTHAISEIRQSLDDHKECPEFIQTLRGKGYRLIAKVTSLDEKVLYPTVWPLKSSPQTPSLKKIRSDNHWHLSLALFRNSRLFSVSIAFVLTTWVLIQVLEVLFPIFDVPEWGLKLAVLILVVGFPLALLYTWLKEIKARKVLLTNKQEESKRKFFFKQLAVDFGFIGLMSVGVGFLAFYLLESIETEKNQEVTATQEINLSIPVQDDLVAVLPVEVSGETQIPDYFKATFQSELIHALTTQQDFKLVSQRAINDLDQNSKISDYATKLGARFLLDGKIINEQDGFSVILSLTDTQNTLQVWGTNVKGKLTELLDVQKEIYRQVFNALALLAEREPSNEYQIISTNDFTAYDKYIQGKNVLPNATNEEELKLAERFFLEALQSDPKFTLASAGLCKTYLEQYEQASSVHSFEAAKQRCSSLLSVGQLKMEAYNALGDLQRTSGELVKAIEYYQQAIALSPENLDAISGMAKSYQELGQYEQADNLFRRVIQIEPGYWRNYVDLGDFFFYIGNYKSAAEQFERVVLMRPDNAPAFNSLGAAYYLDFQLEKATQAWTRSLEIEPSGENYSNLGTALFFSHHFEDATKNYLHAIKLKPQDPILWSNLAEAQKYSNRPSDSKVSFQKALALSEEQLLVNPNDTELLSLQARILSELGRCAVAMETVDELVPRNISDPYLYYDFSLASLRCLQVDKAKALIHKAMDLGYPRELLMKDIQFASIIDVNQRRVNDAK